MAAGNYIKRGVAESRNCSIGASGSSSIKHATLDQIQIIQRRLKQGFQVLNQGPRNQIVRPSSDCTIGGYHVPAGC